MISGSPSAAQSILSARYLRHRLQGSDRPIGEFPVYHHVLLDHGAFTYTFDDLAEMIILQIIIRVFAFPFRSQYSLIF